MPRRLIHLVRSIGVVAVVTMATACDTGDGRTMRPPTNDERANVPTTTTTTTTLVPPPADIGAPLPGGDSFVTATSPAAAPGPTTTAPSGAVPFALRAPWPTGGAIDARFTCDGEDRSPLLTWTAPPPGTVEMALVVSDDDAAGYVHWAVAAIPATAGEKGEGATITGAVEGVNDSGITGWSGPCPPAGAAHTYRFTLYALSQQAELPDGFTGAELTSIAAPAAVAITETSGTYTRAA